MIITTNSSQGFFISPALIARCSHRVLVYRRIRDRLHCRSALSYVKVCGITNPEDAELAASAGANLIGMILWPKAKRSVPLALAAEIAAAARRHGAEPVGVFVDEDAATIESICKLSGISIAQLHGNAARAALQHLSEDLAVIYVMHASNDGTLQTSLPKRTHKKVDFVLVDSLVGGSGESFDWTSLEPPTFLSSRGWLLAGGLSPDNVSKAVQIANPTGVDVSSGVCGDDGLKKDREKVEAFVSRAWNASKE